MAKYRLSCPSMCGATFADHDADVVKNAYVQHILGRPARLRVVPPQPEPEP